MHVSLYLNKNLKHVFECCDSIFIDNEIGINP